MNIFIAFSGATAKRLAGLIRNWLPGVLKGCKPFFAATDIEKGARWRDVIPKQLKRSHATLVCLTKTGLSGSWVYWETGQVGEVCPLLFGMSTDEVTKGPLESFQATEFQHDDLWKSQAGQEERKGIGQIQFVRSPSGRIESGRSSFDDTNMRDYYATKRFGLARATRTEAAIMTGTDSRRKAVLLRKKLRET